MLDLCMFAEAGKNEQELCLVGSLGKAEAMVTEGVLRVGLRANGLGSFVETPIRDENVKHQGLHHGASYLEHVAFADAIRRQLPPAITLTDGLWSVAVGEAAHLSIQKQRPVDLSELNLVTG
jgi:predicted dehydrogenase